MKVKITSINPELGQTIEFNVPVKNANTSISPITSLKANQRWAKLVTIGCQVFQVTKLDLIYTLIYTDCKGKLQHYCDLTSTIFISKGSELIENLSFEIANVLDIIIPEGVNIVNQDILDILPTSNCMEGNCAYSVFTIVPKTK